MKRAQGVRIGRPPTLREEIVQRIRKERKEGETLVAIADGLNDDRAPTAQGGARWYASTVRAVLARQAR